MIYQYAKTYANFLAAEPPAIRAFYHFGTLIASLSFGFWIDRSTDGSMLIWTAADTILFFAVWLLPPVSVRRKVPRLCVFAMPWMAIASAFLKFSVLR